jgi:hypothetical protein
MHPYIRKADNRLHMIALVEILLMLMAGNIFATLEETDELMDAVLSVVLIGIVCGFFAWWVATTSKVVIKLLSGTRNPCIATCVSACTGKSRRTKGDMLEEESASTETDRQRARVKRSNADNLLYDGAFAIARVDLRHDSRSKFSGIEADNIELQRNKLYGVEAGVGNGDEKSYIQEEKQEAAITPVAELVAAPQPQVELVQGNFDMDVDFDDFE